MNRRVDDKDHQEWFTKNRHLLGLGDILHLGEELTAKEKAELESWYQERATTHD